MAFGKTKAENMTPGSDIVAQKKGNLDLYNAQFDHAVSLITDTIDSLKQINLRITETVKEIEDYEAELAATKNGLASARARNEIVIAKYASLISAD